MITFSQREEANMKKIKFNKVHKILLIIITNVLIINIIYTYQDYQSAKNHPKNQLPGKNIVMNINNELSSDFMYMGLSNIVKKQIKIYSNNYFTAFDNSCTPFYNCNFINTYLGYGEVTSNLYEKNKELNLDNIDYQSLKNITDYIKKLAEKEEKMVATFNYDAITDDGVVFVDKITYFAINDNVFINDKKENIISKDIKYILTPFGYYNKDENGVIYFDEQLSSIYGYLEKQMQNVVGNKKFDRNGYYEMTNPDIDDILLNLDYIDDDNNKLKYKVKVCFQKLDRMYGIYSNSNYDENLYSSQDSETGYIAWFEYYMDGDLYTFATYLSENYINYLISLFMIIGSYFLIKIIVNKNALINSIDKPILKQPKVKREVTDKEDVDLENQLTRLIDTGKNLFIFKNIEIKYQANPLVVLGNKGELTKVINDIFHFILNHTTSKNNLVIKIENRKIYFINNDHSITSKELEELNDVFEIIEAHDFQHSFSSSQNSYQIIIDMNYKE